MTTRDQPDHKRLCPSDREDGSDRLHVINEERLRTALLGKRTQAVVQFLLALVIYPAWGLHRFFRDWAAGIHFEAQILKASWKTAKLVLTQS